MNSAMSDGSSSAAAPSPDAQIVTTPPIGVAIPTYNRSDVLLRCFEHLEAQTFKDFEVLVVDDGSKDETPQLLEEYAAKTHLRFRYVRQQNAGPACARNHALALLRAPVFLMIGDDIMASPDLVRQHLTFHQQHPQPTALAVGYTRWSHDGQTVTPFMRWLEEDSPLQFAYKDLLSGVEPTWEHFYTSNLSGKTELLRSNTFNESFKHASMEDIELGYRLARQGKLDMHFLRDAVAEHIHPTDVSRSCRRMLTVGYATEEFWRAWPDRVPATPAETWKHRLRRRILERGTGLAALRRAASLLTKFSCPNPLLKAALLLHFEAGLRQAQAASRQS